jgi:ribosome maturation factor RimP
LSKTSGATMADALEREIEAAVEGLGYEVVELERVGSRTRPILRLRIDRIGAEGDEGVTLEDCTRVSRALESSLDERGDLSERYVLEVSSPGVERPLVRARDFQRFAGREIALHGRSALHGNAKRVEGELLGLAVEEGEELVRLRTGAGEEISIPRSQTTKIHLVYRWGAGGR